MAFVRKQGKTKIMYFPNTTGASGVIAKGDLAVFSSGAIIPATASTTAELTVGVAAEAITATDARYTTAGLIAIEVPVEKWVVWEADVTATHEVGDIGGYFDLTNAGTVNRAASTENIVFCTNFISTTKGCFVLNVGPECLGDYD
jgi:hypothetical protein